MVMRLKSGSDLNYELNQLRKDISRLKDDLRSLAESAVGAAKSRSESLRSSAEDSFKEIREYAEERPLTVMFASLGIGLLLGAAMSACGSSRYERARH